MSEIKDLVKGIKNLMPMPAIIHQILDVVEKPDVSVGEIADVIQYDPAITASVLRACNSAYFGLKNPAESIKDAVSILGMDQIVEIVLMKSVSKTLSDDKKGYGLYEGAMWKYSVFSALIAKQIAKQIRLNNVNMIFTSALLKDIGKIVLDKLVSNSFEKISELVVNKNYSFCEAEKSIIGIDHAELGGLVAKLWKFSPKMENIIRQHHCTDVSVIADKEIATVYLADCICMMTGMGVGSDGLAYRFNNQAMQTIGFKADDITGIIAHFAQNMHELEAFLNAV